MIFIIIVIFSDTIHLFYFGICVSLNILLLNSKVINPVSVVNFTNCSKSQTAVNLTHFGDVNACMCVGIKARYFILEHIKQNHKFKKKCTIYVFFFTFSYFSKPFASTYISLKILTAILCVFLQYRGPSTQPLSLYPYQTILA